MPTLYERYLIIRQQNPELPELGHNSLGNIGKHIKREMLKRIPEWNPEKTTIVDSSGETLNVVLYPENLTGGVDMCIKEFYRRIGLGKKPPPAPIQVTAPPEPKKARTRKPVAQKVYSSKK